MDGLAVLTPNHRNFSTPKTPDSIQSYERKLLKKIKTINESHKKRPRCNRGLGKNNLLVIVDNFSHSCAYCGFPFVAGINRLEFDHVVPLSLGGEHSIRNVVPCCTECNAAKGVMHPKEWLKSVSNDRVNEIREHWKQHTLT